MVSFQISIVCQYSEICIELIFYIPESEVSLVWAIQIGSSTSILYGFIPKKERPVFLNYFLINRLDYYSTTRRLDAS